MADATPPNPSSGNNNREGDDDESLRTPDNTDRNEDPETDAPDDNDDLTREELHNLMKNLSISMSKAFREGAAKAPRPLPPPQKVKAGKPAVFTGKSSELSPWLTHLKLDFRLQKIEDVESKILYAASWMGGDPSLWFKGIVDDYFASSEDERRPVTAKIFDEDEGWVNFEEEITKMYGERDEQKQAEDRLERLSQVGSATSYLSAFNRDRYRVNWDESALKHRFYKGLKPEVKDELCKLDRYAYNFDDYANEAIKIDARLYERRMEDRGRYNQPRMSLPKANQGKKLQHKSTSYGTHAGPMDIGMVGKAQTSSGQQRKQTKSKVQCFNCNKHGHYAKECKQAKKRDFTPLPEGKTVRAVNKDDLVVRMVSSEDLSWMDDLPDHDCGPYDNDSEYESAEEEPTWPTLYVRNTEALCSSARRMGASEAEVEQLRQRIAQLHLGNVRREEPSGTSQGVQVAEDRLLAEVPAEDETPEVQVGLDRLRTRISVLVGSQEIQGSHRAVTTRERGLFTEEVLQARGRYVEATFVSKLPDHAKERFSHAAWIAENEATPEGSLGHLPKRWYESMGPFRVGPFKIPVYKYLGPPVVGVEHRLYHQAISELKVLRHTPDDELTVRRKRQLVTALERFINAEEVENEFQGFPAMTLESSEWREIKTRQREGPYIDGNPVILDALHSTPGAFEESVEHESILWVSCVHDSCTLPHHQGLKIYFEHFPTAEDGSAVTRVYADMTTDHYDVDVSNGQVTVTNNMERNCILDEEPYDGRLARCNSWTCSVHMHQKAQDWHRNYHKDTYEQYQGNQQSRFRRDYEFQAMCRIEPFEVNWNMKSDTKGVTNPDGSKGVKLNVRPLRDNHPRIRLGNGSAASSEAGDQ